MPLHTSESQVSVTLAQEENISLPKQHCQIPTIMEQTLEAFVRPIESRILRVAKAAMQSL